MTTEDWLRKNFGSEAERATDLGHDHWFTKWTYMNSDVWAGISICHPKGPTPTEAYKDSSYCLGSVAFDIPEAAEHDHKGAVWQVQSLEPLTISPSVLCDCGDHGFIREGAWIGA